METESNGKRMSRRRQVTDFVRRIFARQRLDDTTTRKILDYGAFRQAAESERLRAYRTGTTLSIVLFELPSTETNSSKLTNLDRMISADLEEIDTAGFLTKGRVGVLLPGISEDDARSWAENLFVACAQEGTQLTYEVLVYPEGIDQLLEHPGDSVGKQDRAQTPANANAYFAIPLHRWKQGMDLRGPGCRAGGFLSDSLVISY